MNALNKSVSMTASGTSLSEILTMDADATAVFYISCDDMKSMFKFQTDSVNFTDEFITGVQYYVDTTFWPNLNPADAMMDQPLSLNPISTTDRYGTLPANKMLVAHDYVRYLATKLFNTPYGVDLFSNETILLENIRALCSDDASGHVWYDVSAKLHSISTNGTSPYLKGTPGYLYLTNELIDNTNICREIMLQMMGNEPHRFANITDTFLPQSIPFENEDTFNFSVNFLAAQGQESLTGVSHIPDRKYQIKLVMVDASNIVNTPVDITEFTSVISGTIRFSGTGVNVNSNTTTYLYNQFISQFAQAVNTDPANIVINSIAQGSIIVNYTITLAAGSNISTINDLVTTLNTIDVTTLSDIITDLATILDIDPASITINAVNQVEFIGADAVDPYPPTDISVVAGNGQVDISWTPPIFTGGADIISYTIISNPVGIRVTTSSTSATITGLDNGTAYRFSVIATNSVGSSNLSAASSYTTPYTVPGKPTIVGVVAGASSAIISWTAPSSNGSAITGYTVTSVFGGFSTTVGGTATSATITGLNAGTSYTFKVVATNSAGNSPISSASSSVTPYTVPGAPTIVEAVAGARTATISWTAPASNGGSTITGYTVNSVFGGFSATVGGTATSATVTGLMDGVTYTFTVVATNAAGSSSASSQSSSVIPYRVPAAPTDVSGVAGNRRVTVSWTAPTDNGGSAITGYTVTSSPGGITASSANGTTTTATVTNLTNGTPYTFTVVAINAGGSSSASAPSSSITPYTVPGKPTGLSAVPGNAQATISWTAPTNNGGSAITGYTVTSSPGGISIDLSGSATSGTVTGLTDGITYMFMVVATNAAGSSEAGITETSTITATVPDAPTNVVAVAGNASVDVSWSAPFDGGSPITGYIVTSNPGGFTADVSGNTRTTATISGLTNGTYYVFTVVAINIDGSSNSSTSSNGVTPYTVPGTPTITSAVPGLGQVEISWSAPASNGGSTITGYTVTSTPGGFTADVSGTTTSATVTGLSNGVSYTFKVVAINAAGNSSNSSASSSVIPFTVPGAPTDISGVAGNEQATVSWSAPASNGGASITGYTVTSNPGGFTSTVGGTARSATVTGLTNGTAYTFTIIATNIVGDSTDSSASSSITPYTVPGSPTDISGVVANGQATISWSAPTSNGGSAITGYTVTSSPGGYSATVGRTSSSATVTGLSNGTGYTFTVVAINAAGNSSASSASSALTPYTVPGAPTDVSGVVGARQVTVYWTVPTSNGGSSITGYVVNSLFGGFSSTVGRTATSATITGLTGGVSYRFTVTAVNAAGNSSASSASSAVTPYTVPGTPTDVMALAGDRRAIISWTAPTDNGGSTITGYTVTSVFGGYSATVSSSETSATITNMTPEVAYTFRVVATNAAGNSTASSATNSVIPYTVPGIPTNVSAIAGNGQATVSWLAPADDGGLTITGYTVTSSPGGFTSTVSGTSSSATVTGLSNGTAYTFTIVATNADGDSDPSSESSAVTPLTVPGAPTDISGVSGVGQVVVSWSAPASNGGSTITGYTVTSSPGGFTKTVSGTATSATVTGLSNGTAYTFSIIATNAAGNSSASSASSSVTPYTVPGAPTGASATAGNAQASVSWSAPTSNGGSAITGYTVTSSPGGFTATVDGTSSSATVSGLSNGTAYTFSIIATNARGNSSASSASSSVTPYTIPGAPTSVSATSGYGQATVSWSAPASNSGSTITGYTVTSSPGGFTASVNGSTTSAIVTGLSSGTAYTFTVIATNAAGDSSASSASSSVTPYTVPGAPTGVSGVAGNVQVVVSWSAPVANGGSAITGYTVTSSPGGFTATSNTTTAIVTGLSGEVAYTFTVVATNAAGNSAASTASSSVTPYMVPGAPTSVTAVAGNAQATVSWAAPASNGGSTITGYTVTSSPGGFTATVTGTTATVTGLSNGTAYTFTVVAMNAAGNSSASSASSSVTPVTIPGAPTGVTATNGNGLATVSWTAPFDGGSAITGYTVTSSPGGFTATVSSGTSASVTGLTNGTAYTFTVVASNASGSSTASSASSSITPTVYTFTVLDPSYNNWKSVATSADGKYITAGGINSPAGIYVSSNYGATWSNPNTATITTLGHIEVCMSTNGQYQYAMFNGSSATNYNIYMSSNYGATWSPTTLSSTNFCGICCDSSGQNIFATINVNGVTSTLAGIYKSTNYGSSWSQVYTSASYWFGICCDAYGQIIYAVVTTSTVYKSINGGTSWASVTGSPSTSWYVPKCDKTGRYLYIGIGYVSPFGTTYKYDNTLNTWTTTTAPTGTSLINVCCDYTGQYVASAQDNSGGLISISSDYGSTWSTISGYKNWWGGISCDASGKNFYAGTHSTGSIGTTGSPIYKIAFLADGRPGVPTGVTAVAGNGQSTVSWTVPAYTGLTAITGYTVTSSPGGFTATVSAGSTTATVTGLTNGTAYTFTVVATNSLGNSPSSAPSSSVTPTVYTFTVLDPSYNNWRSIATSSNGQYISATGLISTTGSTGASSGIYTSSNYGVTWTKSSSLYSQCVCMSTNGQIQYAINSSGTAQLNKSSDYGATWSVLSNSPNVPTWFYICCDNSGQNVYACTASSGSIYKSADAGATWSTTSAPTATNWFSMCCDAYGQNVFAIVTNGSGASSGVYKSSNYGSTWTQINSTARVWNICCCDKTGSYLYAGVYGGLVYKYYNSTWTTLSPPSGNYIGLCCDYTGQHVACALSSAAASIYISSDYGSTFTVITGYTNYWGFITCDSSGQTYYAGFENDSNTAATGGGPIYKISFLANTGLPNAPTGVTAVVSAGQPIVSWTAPTSSYINAGSNITGYTVTSSPAGFTSTVTGTSVTATGLTLGTTYTFSVVTNNVVGSSSAATSSAVKLYYSSFNIVNSTLGNWRTSATSADGKYVSAGGYLSTAKSVYISSDYGSTWSQTNSPAVATPTIYHSNCMSSTGQYQFAVINGTSYPVYMSSNYGVTWAAAGNCPSITSWGDICCDSSGQNVFAVGNNAIYKSADYGSTWAVVSTSSLNWGGICCDASGQNVFSSIYGGTIYKSSNGGSTWTTTSAPTKNWYFCRCDKSGSYVYCSSLDTGTTGYVYKYTNSTNTWTQTTAPVGYYIALCCDYTGQYVACAQNTAGGIVYYSSDYGATFVTVSGYTNTWGSMSCDGSGRNFYVGFENGSTGGAMYKLTYQTVVTVPGIPNSVAATVGNAQSTVSWTAPYSTGGSAITGYTVTSSPGGFTATVNGTTTTATVTGLTNGTAYTFSVVATNSAGNSPIATSSVVTPCTVPQPPTGLSATGGNLQATVTWTIPTDNGGSAITAYRVTSSPGSVIYTASGATATTATLTGLSGGVSYTFTAIATNSAGNSASSSPSSAITVYTIPGAPTGVTATAGNTQATVSWTAPVSTGGTSITGYTVTSSPGSYIYNVSGGVTSTTATGLSNGTAYTFTVVATNIAGNSAASTASSAITPFLYTMSQVYTPTSTTIWRKSASSSSGQYVIAANVVSVSGNVFISSNYGATFTKSSMADLSGGKYCRGVSISSTGQYQYAAIYGSYVYKSSDYGVTWSATNSGIQNWTCVCCDSSGQNAFAAINGGAILKISNYGASSAVSTGVSSNWNGICCDAAGQNIFACSSGNNYVYCSTNYGSTWASLSPPGNAWYDVCCDASGQYLYACTGTTSVKVYLYYVPFTSWYTITSAAGMYYNVCCDSTGKTIAYSQNSAGGNIYVSYNSGTTWTTVSGYTNLWGALSCDASGQNFIAGVENTPTGGGIYKISYPTASYVPSVPKNVSVTTGNAQATISWTVPDSSGASAITGYGISTFPASVSTTSTGTSVTLTGLSNGGTYSFIVWANNIYGSSQSSNPSSRVLVSTIPTAPVNLFLYAGINSASMSWSTPSSNGGSAITSYTITVSPGGSTVTTTNIYGTTITGLSGGVTYTFNVVANNVNGSSPALSGSTTVYAPPGAPTSVTATAGTGQATVSWTAPASTNGSAIAGYTVTSSPGGFTATSTTTSAVVKDLSGGVAYTFTVIATNTGGNSAASADSSAVTPTAGVPGTPTNVTTTIGTNKIVVYWTSGGNGGSAITGYTVTSNPGSVVVNSTTTSAVFTTLTPGTAYTFTVVATNANGSSSASTASSSVTDVSNSVWVSSNPPNTNLAVPAQLCSTDGTKIFCVYNANGITPNLYFGTMNGSGYTWATLTSIFGNYTISRTAISGDGNTIAATLLSHSLVYVAKLYGGTFVWRTYAYDSTETGGTGLSINYDGSIIALCTNYTGAGNVYVGTLTNGTYTWTSQTTSGALVINNNYRCIAMNQDGTKIATVAGNNCFVSSLNGSTYTWVNTGQIGGNGNSVISYSYDGTRLFYAVGGNVMYMATITGTSYSWVTLTYPVSAIQYYSPIGVNSNGTKIMVAGYYTPLYSADISGTTATWSTVSGIITGGPIWCGSYIDPSGQRFAAAGGNGVEVLFNA